MQQRHESLPIKYHGRSLQEGFVPIDNHATNCVIAVCLTSVCVKVQCAMMELHACCFQEAVHGMVLHAA